MTATSDTHPTGDGDSPGPAATSPAPGPADAAPGARPVGAPDDAPSGEASAHTPSGAASPASDTADTPPGAPESADADPDAAARVAARRGPARKPRKPPKEPFQAMLLARRYPTWGAASLGLLVAGVVAGYVMLVGIGAGVIERCSELGPAACDPRDQARGMALPVLGTVLGLLISLFIGRLLASRGRQPMPATWVGWGVFLASLVVTAFILV